MDKTVSYNNKLSRRVLIYILLCSSFLSIVSIGIQLSVSFNENIDELDQKFANIETSYIPSISTSLWDFNEPLVEQQIKGIVELPDISYAKITTSFGKVYQYGDQQADVNKEMDYAIKYGESDIGNLTVSANYDDIYEQIRHQAGYIIISEFVKTFLVALFIMFIVHWAVTRHIYQITHYSKNIKSDNLDLPLELNGRKGSKDELDDLVDAVNNMRVALKHDIVKLEEAEDALLNLNSELEVKVYDRTAKLAASNQQLQSSLDDLTLAKDQLVQSEKMASLGQLVAGVAHEVNTPLGICVTSITALKEKVGLLTTAIETESLTKSKLTKTLALLNEYQEIIERSLNKAVELIRGFKSVAVEQHTDPKLSINLAQHVNDVVNTVKTLFKRKDYTINLLVNDKLNLITYPSAWNQILTNFLTNSHVHGFEDMTEGEISIEFIESDDFLTLIYRDNGRGMNDDVKSKVFDPFVTTKRGQGGSGLGMNIVFNLVDAKLKGTIRVLDQSIGCGFEVVVPLERSEQPD